jgi:hypothetical protein
MYPDKAKEIDQGFEQVIPIVWNAFTKYTGIKKLFSFFIIPSKNTAGQGPGYPEDHS